MTTLELALYALVFAAPLALGGVHAVTQLVLASGALALLLVTALGPLRDRGVRIPPFAWIALAALLCTLVQLVPLPLALLRTISPHAAALRAEVDAHFAPITLDVAATSLELCKLVAASCVLLVGAEILRRCTTRTAEALAMLGGALCAILWIHRLVGAVRIYGFYAPHSLPGGGFFAPFVSGNHAASLLALCSLAAAGAAFGRSGAYAASYGALAFVAGASVLATTSRGGALGLAAGALFLVTGLATERFGRMRALTISLTVVTTLGAGGLVIADGLRGRFHAHERGATLTDNQKTRGWLAGLKLADAYVWTGVGRGAFEAPAASTRLSDEGVRLVYPENVVVQVASEWGWPVGLALLGALTTGFVVTLRRCRLTPALLGLAAGIIAVAVHELFDFGTEFPGIALPVTLSLAALVACAEENDRSRRRPRPRVQGFRLAVVIAVGAVFIAAGAVRHGETLAEDLARHDDLGSAVVRHPASAELEMRAAEESIARKDAQALHHLNRAMRLQPSAWGPHALAAGELERLHLYGQAALEYRLAQESGASADGRTLVRHLGRFALDAVPKNADSYLRLGAVYAAYNRWDDATRAYQRAAELDPGPDPRAAWLRFMPVGRRPEVLEVMGRSAKDPDELATVVSAWTELRRFDRAEQVAATGMSRYPASATLAVAEARMRIAKGDLEGARKAIGRIERFDDPGRVAAAQVLVDLARASHDADQLAAAQSRLRLLRRKAHMEEPASGGNP